MADYYIDLHSGDDYEDLTPFVYYAGKGEKEVIEIARKMAQHVDVPYMVRSNVRPAVLITMLHPAESRVS